MGGIIAVRVAGKSPQASVPPAPPALTVPTYPAAGQPTGAYPSQQFTTGCPLTATPPASYMATPVPWGPPVPPPPYGYAPPPYTSAVPFPGQTVPPYGMPYPPPPSVQPAPPGAPSQSTPSSAAQQNYPPGVQSERTSSAPPVPTSVYASTIPAMQTAIQPVYPASSLSYAPYYSAVPPPAPAPTSTTDHSQSMGNVPWAVNLPMAPPPASSTDQTTQGADAEYDKFMAEMK